MFTRIGINLKFVLFQNYWLALILAIALIPIISFLANYDLKNLITIIGLVLSFFYFLQKQKLEELQLFRSLFKEFNERYDGMNEEISKIRDKENYELTQEERTLLIDYFNLCAEEYLYYTNGYIDPKVWSAWYNGMKDILESDKIKILWEKEKKSDSYYGLPF